MKIKYLKVKNFLSIADKPIIIDFEKLSNIVNIKGKNLDAENGSSNASGKTTILLSIIYGLYGKLIKDLNHKDAINIKSKKGLEIEIHWENSKGEQFCIIRKRSPDNLIFIKNNEDISVGGLITTQELIQKEIKLNYESFVNVVYFGQHNTKSFLSGKAEEKRKIAENLLSLDKYADYHKKAKERLKSLKEKHASISYVYENTINENNSIKRKQQMVSSQHTEWKSRNQSKTSELQKLLLQKQNDLNKVLVNKDISNYEEAQKELVLIEGSINEKTTKRSEIHALLEKVDTGIQQKKDEKQDLMLKTSILQKEMVLSKNQIMEIERQCNQFKAKQGGICDDCLGEITENNISKYLETRLNKIKNLQLEWKESKTKKDLVDKDLEICNKSLDKLLEGKKLIRDKEIINLSALNSLVEKKINLTKISPPTNIDRVELIKNDLEHIKEKISSIQSDKDPYANMFSVLSKELEENESKTNISKGDLKALELQMPYIEFWISAFGDHGIRSFVLDEIIPTLNSRINYWLECLMEGKIQLHFNNQLEERIEKKPIDDDPFIYASLSGGENSRVMLAVALAFSYILQMNSDGVDFVFFDEIGNNLDQQGIIAIYKVICDLAKDRQVMVISHDQGLLDLLENNCETLTVIKENGISRLEK